MDRFVSRVSPAGFSRIISCAVRLFLAVTMLSAVGLAQGSQRARLSGAIDDNVRVTLRGNTHPLARAKNDQGVAPDSLPMRRMLLLLSRAPEQQAALEKMLQDQQDPTSPSYRQWLSPDEFSRRFSPAQSDVQQISAWLQSRGFTVTQGRAGNSVIEFSGSAAQVKAAFRTEIHKYKVNGRESWANSSDPQIPAALSPVVAGVVSLNNFPRKRYSHTLGTYSRDAEGKITSQYTVSNGSTNYFAVGPGDFATIYNTKPLLQAGTNGAGQTIAVLGVSNVKLQDIADFRNLFGLGAGNASVVIDGVDPGIVPGDESESLLDLEWASAVAPGANVVLVSAEDTETSSGLDLAALHVIDNNLASVMTVSYGDCEAHLGNAENQFIKNLWQQAAAQGITVTVSSGDDGSAGCDNQNTEYIAKNGFGVNGVASTPYNVAVGGTDFDDVGTQNVYWSTTNDSTRTSARSYIPERTWNETCAGQATSTTLNVCPVLDTTNPDPSLSLWSGSGGASDCSTSTTSGSTTTCQSGTAKPAWQSGTGVPNDGVRDLPDVSLFAAGDSDSKSFYVMCEADAVPSGYQSCQPNSGGGVYFLGVGGTSASAPAFAGIIALANQKAGSRLGNVNYLLYSLAAGSGASCTSNGATPAGCIFNDVVRGNVSVPCKAGSPHCSVTSGTGTGILVTSASTPAFAASAGYDLATGLGSVNAANLVTAIATKVGTFTPTTTSLTLNGGTTAVSATHGAAINVGVAVSPTSSVGSVSLLGSAGGFDKQTLSSGAASWSSQLFPGGSYSVKAHYPGDGSHGASDSSGIAVTINPEASKSFLNFVSFSSSGITFNSQSVAYGSPYVLRVDVGDSAATLSASQGISSKCASGTASCPTGTITLTSNGSPLDGGSFKLNAAGYTEDELIQLPAGSYNVVANYPGDASYNASSASAALTVTKAPTTFIAYNQNPNIGTVEYGVGSQINGNVNSNSTGVGPTGSFSWTDNGAPANANVVSPYLQSIAGNSTAGASLNYFAVYSPNALGTHSLVLQYSGDANYSGATASTPVTMEVGKAKTYYSGYSVSPGSLTPSLSLNIRLTFYTNSRLELPTGGITFYDNGQPISGTVTYTPFTYSSNGYDASITTTLTQSGSHAITAQYPGDAHYQSLSVNMGSVNVYDKLPTSVPVNFALSPALKNYPENLTTTVAIPYGGPYPTPTGTITFSDNGVQLAGTVAYTQTPTGYGYSLTGTLPYTFDTSGTHNITAAYSGDSLYAGSTSAVAALTVVDSFPTTLQWFSTFGRNAVNQPNTLAANIAGPTIYNGPVMGGTVTFSDNGTVIPGNATVTSAYGGLLQVQMPYTFTTKGTHSIVVQYSGDSHYAAMTSAAQTVNVVGPLSLQVYPTSVTTYGGSGSAQMFVTNSTSADMSVTYTCTPDSTAATCSLSPPSQTVTAGAQYGVTVNFTVPAITGAVHHSDPFGGEMLVFAGVLAGLGVATRRKRKFASTMLLGAFVLCMASCGGGGGNNTSTGGGGISSTPQSKTYNFTITATSGANSDTQTLAVTVVK